MDKPDHDTLELYEKMKARYPGYWRASAGAQVLIGETSNCAEADDHSAWKAARDALDSYVAELETDRAFVDRLAHWLSKDAAFGRNLPESLRRVLRSLPERHTDIVGDRLPRRLWFSERLI